MTNQTSPLTHKHCVPCQGGTAPLTQPEIDRLLGELRDTWTINEFGHLYQNYAFSNFQKAMDFANQIALIAEQENHHPDLQIAWGKCAIEIWTHKIHGLTESDFILASKIEAIRE